jgi:hypothetical protein
LTGDPIMHIRCVFCGSDIVGKAENVHREEHMQCRECGAVNFFGTQAPESGVTGIDEVTSLLSGKKALEKELERLQECCRIGNEVSVEWLPGVVKQNHGKILAEEVHNDTIMVYSRDLKESVELVQHGFAEWLLNQHAKPYMEFINHLIALFEDTQYSRKEKIVKALTDIISDWGK